MSLAPHLQALSASSVYSVATEGSSGGGAKKPRADFTSSYADSKAKELELHRDKFDWEKSIYEAQKYSQERIKEQEIAADTRRAVMLELIRQNKSGAEVKAFSGA
jgi:hypothetical protein